ncbi:MAG: PRC-barrel domain-containing protein [Bacillota bacterium]
MKKTQQVLGLPVIAISSGDQLGSVTGIVVNPEQGKVECLLVDRENWYGEMRTLPYGLVLGIGEFAVTISQSGDVSPVSSNSDLVSLLDRNIQVIKAGVMTRSGQYIGSISEFVLDEKSGKILGCEIVSEEGSGFVVPGDKVVTYGAKFIVIEDGFENYRLNELTEAKAETAPKPAPAPVKAKEKAAPPVDPVEVFESRQRQYLAGKKATKKIVGTGGLVIVNEGDVITEEIIEKALSMDKYIELTMNVSD